MGNIRVLGGTLALAVAATFAAQAQIGAVATAKVTATVESIDQKTREVTLKDTKSGNKVSFVAGPEVKNLAQVSKGDLVTIAYGEAIALKLERATTTVRERSVTESGQRAKPGEMPGMVAMREVKVVASIDKIDMATGHVTLRGPEHTETVKVQDAAILKGLKEGDFVKVVYTEAVAIGVEKAPASAPAAAPKY